MGTRGAIGFKINGEYKVTYNNFDSYMEGLGKEVISFCNKIIKNNKLETLKENVKKLELLDPNKPVSEYLIKKYSMFANNYVGNQKKDDPYCLLRETQGSIMLDFVLDGSLEHIINSEDFLYNSLYCEYAYIIDLDLNVLNFYSGFQKTPDPKSEFSQNAHSNGFYPVSKVHYVPLDGKIKFFECQKIVEIDED